ncbi:hypothetical protein A1D22_10955 [Pasteurellaceae bacterium LFhippo2]|nr:hypothetical protein [Pasteurellaceae bacterium LFhippo2]
MEKLKELAKLNYHNSTNNIYLRNDFINYSSELTTLQKRIIFYAISLITEEDRELDAEELSQRLILLKVNDFFKLFETGETSSKSKYKKLENEIKDLYKKPVSYVDEFGTAHDIGWFSKTSYFTKASLKKFNQEKGTDFEECASIGIRFTYDIAQILININEYTKYNYLISHSLKFKYSIRIYELLQKRKDTNLVIMKLEDFANALALPETYKKRSQLKSYVLKKAQEELNEKLHLGFNFSFNGDNIFLSAEKNDNDLMNEIFDVKQIKASKNEEEQLLKEHSKEQQHFKYL